MWARKQWFRQTSTPALQLTRKLCLYAGMMFIFGLNFQKKDVQFAKKQMDAIFSNIPSYAIQSFEVGNEVSSSSNSSLVWLTGS